MQSTRGIFSLFFEMMEVFSKSLSILDAKKKKT